MTQYILIETALFTAQMNAQLRNGSASGNGLYSENNVSTLREIQLISDASPKKWYYILKWSDGRPTSVFHHGNVNTRLFPELYGILVIFL